MSFFGEMFAAVQWSVSSTRRALLGMLWVLVFFPGWLFLTGYLVHVIRAAWSTNVLPEWAQWGHMLADWWRWFVVALVWGIILFLVFFVLNFLPVLLVIPLTVIMYLLFLWLFTGALLMVAETHQISSGLLPGTIFTRCTAGRYVRGLLQALILTIALGALAIGLASLTTFLIIVPVLVYMAAVYIIFISSFYLLAHGWQPRMLATPNAVRRR